MSMVNLTFLIAPSCLGPLDFSRSCGTRMPFTVKMPPSPRPSHPRRVGEGDLFSCAGVNRHIEAVHELLDKPKGSNLIRYAGVYFKLMGTGFFWGGTFIAGRIVAQQMGPYSASFMRFSLASLMLVSIVWKMEGRLPKPRATDLIPLILMGITGVFAYNVFLFKSLQIIDAGRAALIVAINPAFIALFGSVLFKDRITLYRGAGIAFSVTGAMVVISRGDLAGILSGGVGPGELWSLGCVASWVVYSLIGKIAVVHMTPIVSVCYSSIAGTAALALPAVREGLPASIGGFGANEWGGLIYLSLFGTVLALTWYINGIKRIGPTKASIFINFVPVNAVFLSFVLLREPLTYSLIAGLVLVSSGVYLTNARMRTLSQ
jgi:drug/metabolite transporter (DMT)-like permease